MQRTRAFTLLEVALIVAIIGMMLMMIFGYLLAPKAKGPLPPVVAPKPILSSSIPTVPDPGASIAPAPAPAPTTPVPTATPAQTIELSPQSSPIFR